MKVFRRLRRSVYFFGAGAVTAYFLDPEAGPERRERLIEQFRSVMGDQQPSAPEGTAEWVSAQSSSPAAGSAAQNDAADAFPNSSGLGDQSP